MTIMLTNTLKTRALWETLRNEAIRKAMKDIDLWRESQTASLISELALCITSSTSNLEDLTCNVGNLDPHINKWVETIWMKLRETTIKMINHKSIEDCLDPYSTELLETDWMCHQSEIETELHAKSDAYEQQLRQDAEECIQLQEKTLWDEAECKLNAIKQELDSKLADEIAQLKNKTKLAIQTAKDNEETHTLNFMQCTPKALKASPLNIKKPKKVQKKKIEILNLTTPPPPHMHKTRPQRWRQSLTPLPQLLFTAPTP